MRLVGKKGLTRRSLLGGAFGLGLAQAGKRKPKRKKPPLGPPEAPGKDSQDSVASLRPGQVVGPGAVRMRFRINGRPYEAALEPRVTLLAALRDAFGLTAAKDGCERDVQRGRGRCGACTVLLDGKPVYACSVLAVEAQDRPIETADARGGRGDRLSPLEESLAAHAGFRCGFCAPGFAVAAKALLAASPHPSRAEIAEALAGNLCLCGAYPGVVRAVEQAAARKKGGDGHAGSG